MKLSHMSNDELRINAEACQRIMHRRPPTAASHRIAARQFNAYRAELARRWAVERASEPDDASCSVRGGIS